VCLCCPPSTFLLVFIAVGAFLPRRCLTTAVSSGSLVPPFRCHVTLHSKVWSYFLCNASRVMYSIYLYSKTNLTWLILPRTSCFWLILRRCQDTDYAPSNCSISDEKLIGRRVQRIIHGSIRLVLSTDIGEPASYLSNPALSNAAPVIYFSDALRKHIYLSRFLILIQNVRQDTFLNVWVLLNIFTKFPWSIIVFYCYCYY
jgi:hypothetical protein